MSKETINPRHFFENQLVQFKSELSSTSHKIRRISIIRIIVFLLTIIGVYVCSNIHLYALLIVGLIGFGFFIFLVIKHAKLYKEKKWYESLVGINNAELALLDGKTENLPTGKEFININHPFTSDLDIFGNGSLFQLIDRSATNKGRQKLAERFIHPLKDTDKLVRRQQAINELKNKAVWRQYFQAHGKLAEDEKFTIESFLNWAKDKTVLFNKPFYRFMLILTPLLGFGIILLISLGYLSFGSFVLFLILPFMIIGGKFSAINKLHNQLSRKTEILKKYGDLFGMIENESFESELLYENEKHISEKNKSTQTIIKKLSGIMAAFDYRLNILVGITLNIFFLWDIRQCIKLEKWKIKYGNEMKSGFEVMCLFDELSSFAGFAFSHPESVFPEFSQSDFILKAQNAKHPFINKQINIGNEIEISGWGNFQIITGANMAGKSTYLRMVGVNMVLAMTGSLVLANKFLLKPVDIFTGIKTTDSLQDGESYFFAELKRLKEIITTIENGSEVFIILDEILRGTNSADKHKGSEGLVKQLISLGASGMIATHDLTLGQLENAFPGKVTNKRFEVEIQNDELVFDYKLKDGISQNLNATFLMKKMGITL